MKFLSFKVALELCKFTIRFCMEYGYHLWTGVHNRYLDWTIYNNKKEGRLDNLKERRFRVVGFTLTAFLKPVVHRGSVINLNLFCRYYFGRCSCGLVEFAPFPFNDERSAIYSDRFDNSAASRRFSGKVSVWII